MIGRIGLKIGLVLGLVAVASADDVETRLRVQKDVVRAESNGDEILAVPLDDAVYAGARDGFPDVRVLDDRGAEVPYRIETIGKSRTVVDHEACPSRIVSLNLREGEALEVVVELDEHAPAADGATIRTPLADFERRVRVYGERSGEWAPLKDDGRIFDYARFMDVRSLDVTFTGEGVRRFRFVIEREQDERESPFRQLIRERVRGEKERETEVTSILRRSFRIDRIDLWRKVERPGAVEDEAFPYSATVLRVETDEKEKTTRIDVESDRQPLTGLRLRTSSRNFSRPARVLVPDDRTGRERWVEIGRGTLTRVVFRDFRHEETKIEFPERRSERYRLVIENADNPPLDVAGVEAEGRGRRLVFLADAGRSYRVAYGSDALDAPRYDVSTVLEAIDRAPRPTPAALGPERPNPLYRPSADRPSRPDGAAFLWLAVVLMVAVLSWALLRAGRRLKRLPTDEFEE